MWIKGEGVRKTRNLLDISIIYGWPLSRRELNPLHTSVLKHTRTYCKKTAKSFYSDLSCQWPSKLALFWLHKLKCDLIPLFTCFLKSQKPKLKAVKLLAPISLSNWSTCYRKKQFFFCCSGWNGMGNLAKLLFKGLKNEIRFPFS